MVLLADAKSKVEESIEAQIDASSEQVERALEKETNEKSWPSANILTRLWKI